MEAHDDEVNGRAVSIEEHRRVVESLASSEARYRQIVETARKSEAQLQEAQELAHIGSWEWDLATDAMTRSRELCRIFGVKLEDLGNDPSAAYERVHPEDRERLRAEMDDAIRERRRWVIEYRILRRDGVRFIHARGEVISDDAGRPIRMFGTAQDITDRREAEARLVLADRMASVGTLAAGVAHEINSPLAYVISNLDLIAEEIRDASGGSASNLLRSLNEMTAEARQGAERVRQIVRGLKTFSRADDDRRVLLDVRRVLDLSINMAFTEMRYRARLVKDYQDIPAVEADEARLGQVFINLLVNAAHAIPEGQTGRNEIRVCTRKDATGRAVIEVHDTGSGIAPEVLGRIFDPFFTTKPVGIGTGLGLSICHGIVTALGGEITVESEPGKGSIFRVALPPGRLEQAADPPPARWTIKPPRAGRVLVVDDETLVGTTIRRVLRDHEVTVVTTGKDALERIFSGATFDVILCDLMMPEMTGMDLHAELSQTLPEVLDRVIFTTGGVFTPTARAFLDRIPNERLEKPFEPQNLRALVQRFLR